MRDDIHIAGMGVVSPIGSDLADFARSLFEGRSAVVASALDLAGIDPVQVPLARAAFDAAAWRTSSRLPADRGTAMALAAVDGAMRDAGLERSAVSGERLGVYWGAGMGGASTFDDTCRVLYGEHRRMRPTTVITAMPNAAVAEIALQYGARGAAVGYACACASAAVAIGEAVRAIRGGWIDIAIAGGSESMLTSGVVATWQALRVLAPVEPHGAAAACRPFSADRAGFALGEGAGALVLESAAHAAQRHARADLVLAGYATNCDASHMTAPDPAGQARAMRAALADAGIAAWEVGHVNAHGTATQAGDLAEATSIADVFGNVPDPPWVSATKAIHGHLLGAGGAVEAIAAACALRARMLPPNPHLCTPDPALVANRALRLVDRSGGPAPGLRCAMSNAFAFGGTNAVLVLGLRSGASSS